MSKLKNNILRKSRLMKLSNSKLVSYTNLSPNCHSPRKNKIDRITPHCVVGQWDCKKIADFFKSRSRRASCNYGIGKNGGISLVVEEKNRSWCSSSGANDNRAITFECASDRTHPYAMNEKVYASLLDLCEDICRRYGKNKLIWIPNRELALEYRPKENEMLITVHRWFAGRYDENGNWIPGKSCPGDWLYNRLGDVANEVTKRLQNGNESVEMKEIYRIRKTWLDAKSQLGAYTNLENAKKACPKGYAVFDTVGKEIYRNEETNSGAIEFNKRIDHLIEIENRNHNEIVEELNKLKK